MPSRPANATGGIRAKRKTRAGAVGCRASGRDRPRVAFGLQRPLPRAGPGASRPDHREARATGGGGAALVQETVMGERQNPPHVALVVEDDMDVRSLAAALIE